MTRDKPTDCMVYTRVSTVEQEREGFSIDAQLGLLRNYAKKNDLRIVTEFLDNETASSTGRAGFNRMLAALSDHPECKTILVEKTDRLSRNQRDYLALDLDKTGFEIHLVRENRVFSRESSPTEHFNIDVQLAQAAFVSRNISAEAKKGMRTKAEQGLWPSYAPIGYINENNTEGRIITPDPERAPLIRKLFEMYAGGDTSIADLVKTAQSIGLRTRRNRRLSAATLHGILTNPIYYGDFVWKGQLYRGNHRLIVSRELWTSVQDVLKGRNRQKEKKARREFPYSGLIKCGTCGCSIVGERKKEKYNYYHCTQYRLKHSEPWIKEEELDDHFSELLESLAVEQGVVDWIVETLSGEEEETIQFHQESITKLESQRQLLMKRLSIAYDDRLDGRIDVLTFDEKAAETKREIAQIDRTLVEHSGYPDCDLPVMARESLELAQHANSLFPTSPPVEKRELLGTLLSNCTITRGRTDADLTHLYTMLADTNAAWQARKAAGAENLDYRSVWYP